MVESNIHYPTDINLLYDAVRCSVRTLADWCEGHGDSRWRQWQYNLRQVKKAYRHTQKLKHSSSQDPDKQATQQQAIRDAHQTYLGLCTALLTDRVVLPKKGRWSQADTARETDPAFVQARRQHSAVESGINALEVHGLDYCPDRGLERFKRYVALAVVGRNLQKVGVILQARALDALQKDERRRQCQAA